MNFHNVEFLISAANPQNFPANRLPEIAFAGKSNVGKSSVINRILNRKNFARVGDKPGKTIHVNYFTVDKISTSLKLCLSRSLDFPIQQYN